MIFECLFTLQYHPSIHHPMAPIYSNIISQVECYYLNQRRLEYIYWLPLSYSIHHPRPRINDILILSYWSGAKVLWHSHLELLEWSWGTYVVEHREPRPWSAICSTNPGSPWIRPWKGGLDRQGNQRVDLHQQEDHMENEYSECI